MQLYLIRHGQSYNNAVHDPRERVKDPELTSLGQRQAELLAEHLAISSDERTETPSGYGLTHLYASPMFRALQTAKPISEHLGLAVKVWIDIHEIGGIFLEDAEGGFVGYPGMTREQIRTAFPDYELPSEISEAGWWNPEDQMETESAAQFRALKVAEALRENARTEHRIALVSHAGFLDRLLKVLLNQLPNVPRTVFYAHYNTAITRIDFGEAYLRMHYINRMDHLPPHLRSW